MYRRISKVHDKDYINIMEKVVKLMWVVVQHELPHFYEENTLWDIVWSCASNSHSLYT
jgi:hypothetical protein